MMAASRTITQNYRQDDFDVSLAGPAGACPAAGESLTFGARVHAYEGSLTPAWHREAMNKVIALVGMQKNWDGYGSEPLRRDTALFALEILQAVMQPRTPMPAVVPSATGVQLEWHEKGIDLELHVSAPYAYEIWFEDRTGQHQPVSEDLSNNLTPAREAVAILTRR